MRDVVTGFYANTLRKLIEAKRLCVSDKVLVVCGGPLDQTVIADVGFEDFTITGLNGNIAQDAERLAYEDRSFDIAIVHAGLHHCYSPHRALLEMYRVARKAVIAFESRDSLLMRTAVRFGLTLDYETDSITADGAGGGVADTGIPNFVYRWTEREVIKTVASFDPCRDPSVKFFYDLRIPFHRLTGASRHIGRVLEPMSRTFAAAFPSQCNEFAFAVFKDGSLKPWIKSVE